MILLQGWGALVGLLGMGVIAAGLQSVTGSRAASFFLAGAALGVFGWWLTSQDGSKHSIFWVPIQYWGIAIALGALVGL